MANLPFYSPDDQSEGGIPERDIAVHGCVMADGPEHACRVPVQTPGLRNLTYAACMPDLTVQEYKGEEACGGEARGHFTIGDVARAHVRLRKQGFVQYLVHSTRMGLSFL